MNKNQNGNEEIPKEIGSNLTGTAIHAKPGHERDIPIDKYVEESDDEKSSDVPKHIENTDAILGDVNPLNRNQNSQEEHNAKKENEQEKPGKSEN